MTEVPDNRRESYLNHLGLSSDATQDQIREAEEAVGGAEAWKAMQGFPPKDEDETEPSKKPDWMEKLEGVPQVKKPFDSRNE